MSQYMQAKPGNPFNTQIKMFHHAKNLQQYLENCDTIPILIEVNLTNRCQLKCPWCFTDHLRCNEIIDTDNLLRFLKDYKARGGKAITWSGGGEPTLHPEFLLIVRETNRIGLDQGLMTNGIYPYEYNASLADYFSWIRFSVDYSDSETYKKFKGYDGLPKVINNIKELRSREVKVGINKNLEPHEDFINDIYTMIGFSMSLGVTYFQVRPALPRIGEEADRQIIKSQITFLNSIDNTYFGKLKVVISMDKYNDLLTENYGRDYTKCRSHLFEPAIDANGDVYPCMYRMKEPDLCLGNINVSNFTEIWQSQQRKDVIKRCDNLDFNKCQVCCKGHEVNKLIHFLDYGKEDVNFI